MKSSVCEKGSRLRSLAALAFVFVFVVTCVALGVAEPQHGQAQFASTQGQVQIASAQSPSTPVQETGPRVALAPDDIIAILKKEPGLTLHIKRLLIQKAYDMGRLLSEDEFTDDQLFRLIGEDSTIRVIVTTEMEDRGYVTLKPSTRELEEQQKEAIRQQQLGAQNPQLRTQQQSPQQPLAGNQAALVAAQAARADAPLQDSGPTSISSIRPEELGALFASGQSGSIEGLSRTSGAAASFGGLSGMSGSLPAAAATMTLNPTIPAANDALGPPPYAYSPNAQQPTVGYTRPQAPRTAADRLRHRPNPYANVPSLYDMYTQVAPPSAPLQRFGADVFRNGTGNFYDIPMDVPVGPDYVLGPGDGLKLDLWGGVSQRLIRTVDREGRIALPEVGTVLVAGRSLGSVQRDVQTALRTQFRDVQADVSLARLRTVRVYVEGDVERPGAYDISALSTPLNAVYTAGGPTDAGSYRIIRHFRGKQLLQEVDSYDLLLHGVRGDIQLLQSGDTILVPPVGAEVTVEGMVRRPAIYELHGEKNLSELLEMAGGVMSTGTLRHVQVERVVAHQRNTMLSLDVPETNDAADVSKTLEAFNIQDGDKVRVSPILPYSYQTVYLDGHVFHPGKYSWHEGMKVSDLVKSYNDLLPEPSQRHAEIIRLQAPDYRPQVIAFNLGDALSGHASDPALQPFDTVRVFSRYAFEDPPVVSVGGEVRDPGQHLTNGETHLRDAVYLAGGLTPDASTLDAQVLRHTQDGKMQVFSVNLAKALAGDEPDNILLQPRDSVIIHRNLQRTDPATVSIQGEVANPGKYPLGEEMTASELVKVAGGFKRSAYTAKADLSRYDIEDGKKVVSEHQEVLLAKAIAGEPDTDVRLRDGDVLTVRQLSGWKDIGASITVNGEVAHPGTYGIQEGERLSSILKRAGGFRTTAYPAGAVLERVQVREISEKTRAELIRKIEAESMNIKPGATSSPGEQAAMLQASMAQKQQVLANLKSTPPSGRLVIHIPNDMSHWENTPADPEVRAGDVLVIPKRPNFVVITGQVYNPAAIGYTPHKNAGWYLRKAGGATELANKKSIFIVRADGSVIGNTSSGFWKGSTLSTIMMPGDTIVVPDKILGGGGIWRNLLATAQLASSVSIAASVLVNAGL